MSAVLRVTRKFPSSGPTIGKVVILILSLGLSKLPCVQVRQATSCPLQATKLSV